MAALHTNISNSDNNNNSMHSLYIFTLISTLFAVGVNAVMPPRFPSKPIPGDSPIEKCELTSPQLLDIHQINLSPNPPMRDSNLTVEATGWLASQIDKGAYVDVEVRLGYIKLLTQRFDLCDLLDQQSSHGEQDDMQCPVSLGEHTLHTTVKIPREVPMGRYTFVARAYSQKDVLLTCLTGDFMFY